MKFSSMPLTSNSFSFLCLKFKELLFSWYPSFCVLFTFLKKQFLCCLVSVFLCLNSVGLYSTGFVLLISLALEFSHWVIEIFSYIFIIAEFLLIFPTLYSILILNFKHSLSFCFTIYFYFLRYTLLFSWSSLEFSCLFIKLLEFF